MCVIEQKIHKHSDGRRSKKEKIRYCHEGRRRGSLCDHVEQQDTGSAATSETIASSSNRPSSSADIITTGRDGKERQYFRVSRNGTKRSSLEGSNTNSRQSLDASSASSSAVTREVRPSTSHRDRRSRRLTKYTYTVTSDGSNIANLNGDTAYDRPPSLEMLESGESAMRPTTDVTDVSPTRRPSYRRPRPRAMIVDTGASMTDNASSLNQGSPGLSNLPRLGRFDQDSAHGSPSRGYGGMYQARVDSLADEDDLDTRSLPDENERQAGLERDRLAASERYQQEGIYREIEARDLDQARLERERMAEGERRQADRVSRQLEEAQARIERDRLAESDRRQADRQHRQAKGRDEDQALRENSRIAESDRRQRIRDSQEAEARARIRAEKAQREHHIQETAAALQRAEEDAEHQRHVNAELAQMARERSVADAHVQYAASSSTAQYHDTPRSIPPSPIRITYKTVPASSSSASSPISARQMTNTSLPNPPATMTSRPISARQPVAIHNNHPSPMPRESLRERGEAVIIREQQLAAAAAARNRTLGGGLSTSLGRMELRDQELDAAIDASMRMRTPMEGRERERERERERVRRYERHQEYF